MSGRLPVADGLQTSDSAAQTARVLTTEILVGGCAFTVGITGVAIFLRQRQQLALTRLAAEKSAELAAAEAQLVRVPQLESEIRQLQEERGELLAIRAALETRLAEERKASAEKLTILEEARAKLTDAFHALSADALRKNNQSFLDLAHATLEKFQEAARGDLEKRQHAISDLVRPVRESLEKVDSKIYEIEKARTGAYESLTAQVRSMMETQNLLRSETANLVKALRSPTVRGRWGEVQLRRVVETAGMVDHCDFFEQQSVNADGAALRPDLLIRLPNEKTIVVDAKAPLAAYLDALDATEDHARIEQLARHAAHVRAHIEALSRKAYWEQFDPAPEFVVLFLPGEMFFSAALERDPVLIEFGAEKRVILATPTTLIALLKAVFHGWRQQKLAQNAQEISELGRDLFKRLSDMGGHFESVGRSLSKAVESYNKAIGSLESRVLVTARKFKELEAAQPGVEIEPLVPIEQLTREFQAPELVTLDERHDPLERFIAARE